eukprot:CAMPEP_0178430534 /NCGR_PEP_ID=MMETSP0689_2-20121128/31368_1 /TAXON_ID=160604 /ORGANISM="Amphidinium massartii, Strain CS-259" /LENGTH=82 /DNA_ID=CAMNT_0020052391 /DNA_START=271 /DNA_END=519 /DNA_ORIENTATION=+
MVSTGAFEELCTAVHCRAVLQRLPHRLHCWSTPDVAESPAGSFQIVAQHTFAMRRRENAPQHQHHHQALKALAMSSREKTTC